MKKLISIILCSALMIGLIPSNAVAASKPTVTKKMTINVGQSKTIKVTGKYIKSKTFKSNRKSIATVNKKGKVTGKKIGTAKITVTVKYKKTKNAKKVTTKKYTCTVTVNVRKSAVPTNKPIIKPNVTQKPNVTERPKDTPEPPKDSSGPQNTKVPSVTDRPQSTPDVPVATETPKSSEEPHNTEVPSATERPQNTPDVPSVTENPSVTERPKPSVEPSPTPEEKKYDYTFSTGTKEVGVIWKQYPSTTQKGIYKYYVIKEYGEDVDDYFYYTVEVPILNDIETIDGNDYGIVIEEPTCTSVGYKDYYDLKDGSYDDNKEIPATGHTSDEIWHTRVDSDGKAGDIWNECTKCGSTLNDIYVMFKENNYTYTKWLQTPSENQEGIMGIYEGVNIKNMTTEQLEEKYDSYDVVFDDGTKDTYYGDIVYKDNGEIQRFDVYAKSTAQMTGTITYPKYEIKEIDLGNGETTKVYGYYDTVMANEVYELLNEYRVENGLAELETNDYMKSLANTRSPEELYTYLYNQQNTDYEYEAHERANKTMCWTVVGENGYKVYGENALECPIIESFQAGGIIQKVDVTAEYIMNCFKKSEGHNENLLGPNYHGVGISVFIGYPQNKDGTFKSYKVAAVIQSFMY